VQCESAATAITVFKQSPYKSGNLPGIKISWVRKMKKMKKRIFALITLIALFALMMLSCTQDASGTATIVIDGTEPVEYKVKLDDITVDNGLISVLEHLKATKELTFEMSGTMIDKVGGLANDYTTGTYIFIYTSVEKDFDVSEWATMVSYKGKNLTSSGVGAAEMTVCDGAVIYITTITYG
jgi:hypothetical protein